MDNIEKTENEMPIEAEKVVEKSNNQNKIAGAIIIAGLLIAGAILLKGNNSPSKVAGNNLGSIQLEKVGPQDHSLGDQNAKVTLIEYGDFQCPFCGKFFKETGQALKDNYINTGKVRFIYRDYAFLGDESFKSAEASWCAGDQGKFWEYHDYLFNYLWDNYYAKNKSGENAGVFSNKNLKLFAKNLGLDSAKFDSCFDSGKYTKAVTDSVDGFNRAVTDPQEKGTPRTYILKKGKVVDVIKGALPLQAVTAQIDTALN